MWPSLEAASAIYDRANMALFIALVLGAAATFLVIWMGKVKEDYLTRDLFAANERIEVLRADNLSLQTVLLPRHVGLIGLDSRPKAEEWFAGMERFAGTEVSIQVVPDREAQNLANEIAIVLMKFGLRPQLVDEKQSGVPSEQISDGVRVSYPIGKTWTPETQNEPWFKWSAAAEALADALTKAGLGVGDIPVPRAGFLNVTADVNPGPRFVPPLTGVYLEVGSRPVSLTLQWMAQRRAAAKTAR
jgi:hypothetical protein